MSLLYSSNSIKYQEGEFKKNQEYMELDHHHYHQVQEQHSSGLTRYRSAPSSFLECLVNSSECEDFRYFRSSSPEMETMLARFMSPCNGSGNSNPQNLHEFEERAAIKQEMEESSQMVYRNNNNDMDNFGNSSMDGSFGVVKSMQAPKMNTVNGSNLVRQNSSPAGFFSNQGVDNGFTVTKDLSSFRVSSGLNVEANPSTNTLNNNLNFSSSGQRQLPQIDEIGDEYPCSTIPQSNIGKRLYMNFDSWDDSSSNDFKRSRGNNGNVFSGFNIVENENGTSAHPANSLTHHLSLPKTASEMATIEKFLQFQGSPCKIRAKRGCATHPRSIAERVRRTRISERMRKLHDLFPNLDKQTNTADMLDLAVEYIKDLQKQVKNLTDSRSKCTCSSLHKLYPNACS